MEKILYVYSSEKIEDLKKDFNHSRIISISYILNMFANIENIDDENFDEYIIDLTTLAFEHGYYKLFIEGYIYKLTDEFKNAKFLVNNLQKDSFLDKFPYIFDSINDKYVVKLDDNVKRNEDIIEMSNKYSESMPLFMYSNTMLDNITVEYKIISIGCLFNGVEDLSFKFNMESIKSFFDCNEIQYIDITQVIDLFKLRKDLILTFEIILRQIFIYKNDIKFLICDEKSDDIKSYLPFTFKIDNDFFNKEEIVHKSIQETTNKHNLKEIFNIINYRLKGHDDFKKDFKFNLEKYMFLNKIGERKIFSIFLTGESGIGKTEFAKMLSDIMYPSESLIKINFGNYSNEGVLNSLIGSPLGYIGSEDGGELINKMKISNSKIILIDEFEKATPSVFHFFYELLEDGKFTDRHGVEHSMDGYIIIFTSNMSRKRYIDNVPDPLKSRFDMVYCFVDLPAEEKKKFAIEVAEKLIGKIYQNENIQIEFTSIENELDKIITHNNLRSIKRKVEDVVITEYYKSVEKIKISEPLKI
ncbi:AAA family ATPase [Clostridium cellulovorans]|uniref:ATPase AAA-2 domain protein n=1 Tax=Clostridium cellulovorans (strain ATCC 35296 / DSM 3052 / OCM 3 / 743B) TaxID=573061 RepID=D9SSY9_CLOC7|nr:AAA family ATPase [Clostridium cellulovorans]ADL52651.1 ATPase AAA-2 domain protein [Clostridium cellulovorans 743B]